MNSIGNGLKYLLKAYLGGCLGCLGAWTMSVVLVAAFAAIFGGSLLSAVQGAVQGIQIPTTAPLIPFGPPGAAVLAPGSGPPGMPPGVMTPPPPDCHKTIKAWVAKEELGSPSTGFARTDGMFPVVENPTDCGPVNAKLLDARDRVLMEKAHNVRGGGRNGYGNYNAERSLAPGPYRMQFWYGDALLQTVELTVR